MAYVDYEELILIAQECEIHPELGEPVWGRPRTEDWETSEAPAHNATPSEEDDFFRCMEHAYA